MQNIGGCYVEEALEPDRRVTGDRVRELLVRSRLGEVGAADRLFAAFRWLVVVRAQRFLFQNKLKAEGVLFSELVQLEPGIPARLGPLILLGEEGLREAIDRFEINDLSLFGPYISEVIREFISKRQPDDAAGDLGSVREPRQPRPPGGGTTSSPPLEDSA
jgi:hypothetical protein